VFHEDIYVDENLVVLEVLGDILFVLGALPFFGSVRDLSQLVQDGCPVGRWG